MREFIKPFTFLVLAGCLALSCTSRGYLNLSEETRNTTITKAPEVAIYVTDEAGSPYDTIGAVIVSSDAANDATATVAKLKTEAARLGADAIVNMKLRYSYGFWGLALEASGTAVKLNQ